MGYSVNLFTDPNIDEEFQCSICHDVLKDPRILNPCEHQFCSTCIVEWRKKSTSCPCCRRDIEKLPKSPRPFLKLLNKLELHCPFTPQGCKQVMPLENYPDHDMKCRFNPANRRKCVGGCDAVLNQFLRKKGTHSCTYYLKSQLESTRAKLLSVWKELNETKEKLGCSEKASGEWNHQFLKSEERHRETEGKLRSTRHQLQGAKSQLDSAQEEFIAMNEIYENLKSTDLQLRETQAKLASAEAKQQEAEVKLKSLEEPSKEMREMWPKFQQLMNKGFGFGLSDTEYEEENDLKGEEEEGEDYGEFRGDEQEGEGEEGNVEEGGEVEEGNVEGGEVEDGVEATALKIRETDSEDFSQVLG